MFAIRNVYTAGLQWYIFKDSIIVSGTLAYVLSSKEKKLFSRIADDVEFSDVYNRQTRKMTRSIKQRRKLVTFIFTSTNLSGPFEFLHEFSIG